MRLDWARGLHGIIIIMLYYAHVLLICPRMRSSALTAIYIYEVRSSGQEKKGPGPGQTVKSGFRAESSGQDRFQAVKNLDPGRGRSYGKY